MWINMFQDFSLKIVHHAVSKHNNMDVLFRNPMEFVKEDEDFKDDQLFVYGGCC
jgi:hypothetical protein